MTAAAHDKIAAGLNDALVVARQAARRFRRDGRIMRAMWW